MVACIGLASGIGAGNPGCAKGPLELQKRLDLDWRGLILSKEHHQEKMEAIASLNHSLAELSYSLTLEEPFFLSIVGDHSCGVGTWSGSAAAIREQGDLGLIWIDAHLDAHTSQTSDSGNIHGMPIAALLGYGDKRLTTIGDPFPKVRPKNLAMIGIRSFEPAELRFLNQLNVRIYMMDEIERRGLAVVLHEAIEIVSKNTAGYGVSFDLDSLDPAAAPAVGTPVDKGLNPEELLDALHLFESHPPLAFELAEYNPLLDRNDKSFYIIEQLLQSLARPLCKTIFR